MDNPKRFFKSHARLILLACIMFLVATTSFALGYLAHREFTRAPIRIEKLSH